MNKDEIFSKVKSSNYKKNSFPGKVCSLILSEEFNEPSDSKSFTEMYNEGPGKNIKPTQLTALMQPLLKEGIVNSVYIKKGKKKTKLWFPGWIDKKEISLKKAESEDNILKNLHPKIKEVSGNLFKNGHYAQAIEEAFKKIVLLVKEKSGRRDLDGAGLMTTVFSKNNPILKFNDLSDQTEKDEQEGWMHLYQGAVLGIRNVKAHRNIIQRDSIKTLEYLSFASLLCKRLEETEKV